VTDTQMNDNILNNDTCYIYHLLSDDLSTLQTATKPHTC